MGAGTEGMKGPRLEFVVRELKGEVSRPHHSMNGKKIETVLAKEPAGYLVYLPSGQSYRLSRDELVKRGFDRQPSIINFEMVQDTKTPAGRYKFAMDDKTRRAAWKLLEEEVIKSCVRRHGPVTAIKEEAYNGAAGTE